MTDKEFQQLCSNTPTGTTLSFDYRDTHVEGKFVSCTEDAFIIEVNGHDFIWPREFCNYRKAACPIPTYS